MEQHRYHSIVFALLSAVEIELTMQVYLHFPFAVCILPALLFFLSFLLESMLSFRNAMEAKTKLSLPYIFDDLKHIHVSHHLILPTLLYISITSFIILNGSSLLTQFVIVLSVITLYALFEGQQTSIRHDFMFDEYLHYIYDSIKIIIYFLLIDSTIAAYKIGDINLVAVFAISEAVAFLLFLLIISRKRELNTAGILYIFFASMLSSILVLLMTTLGSATIILALMASVIYYLLIGIIHHKINASLTAGIVLEYILIAGIILVVLTGISF